MSSSAPTPTTLQPSPAVTPAPTAPPTPSPTPTATPIPLPSDRVRNDGQRILVTLDAPVRWFFGEGTSSPATNIANYAVNGVSLAGSALRCTKQVYRDFLSAFVSAIECELASCTWVRLTFAPSAFAYGARNTLAIVGVRDTAGRTMDPDIVTSAPFQVF